MNALMEQFRFEEQESKTCSELARFEDTEENHLGMFEEIHPAMAMRLVIGRKSAQTCCRENPRIFLERVTIIKCISVELDLIREMRM